MATLSKELNVQNKLFNRQFNQEISYNAEEVDAVIGFFQKRNFDEVAAINTALIILQQAKKDKTPVFEIIDTLSGLNNTQMNNVVAQILNLYRSSSSIIGYRPRQKNELFDQRNIIV